MGDLTRFAARRAYSIDTAMEIVFSAQAKFLKKPPILYSLACYHCQIGKAKRYLKRAFAIDRNWRKAALEDEDLRRLWIRSE